MRRISLFLLLAAAANAGAATLTLGNLTGNAGATINTTVNLQTGGAQISGVQFDLVFDKTALTITSTTGTDAALAGKSASTNQLSTGLRVIVVGFNQDPIGDPTSPTFATDILSIAKLKIVIGAGAASSNYPLTFTNVSATDANGQPITIGTVTSGNLAVGTPPALSISKTHAGNFAQGQSSAAYTVTVSNQAGAASTNSAVTVTENIPTGLTLQSMTGTGWDCSGVTTCTRSDPLAGGASYPAITATVSVANNAAASVTNQVTVSGGGALPATANDPTTIIVPQPQTITFPSIAPVSFGVAPFTLNATASSGLPVSFAASPQVVCTVAGSTLTIVGAGTCTITASQAGNAAFALANPVSQNLTVNPAAQTITFPQPADTALNAGPVTLTASSTSALAVTYASTTQTICTVANSSVTLVAKGTCSITASQAGNVNFNAATSVSKSFTVLGNGNVITFPQPVDTELFAGPVNLTGTANSSLAVSYASNSTGVCTVAGSTVTLVSVGACSITANQAGDSNFAAAIAVTRTFSVLKGSQTITFGTLTGLTFGASAFNLTASASSNLAVSYASNSLPVCTVSGSAVTLVGAGTCSITASQTGNASYAAAPSVTQTFAVAQAAQTITFNALSNTTFGTSPFTVSATASSNLTVSFASGTPAVCTVSGSTVTLAGVGTCSITASQTGNTNFGVATPVTQSFTVGQGSPFCCF